MVLLSFYRVTEIFLCDKSLSIQLLFRGKILDIPINNSQDKVIHMKIRCIKCNQIVRNFGKQGRFWCDKCGTYACFNCKKGDNKCPTCRKKMKPDSYSSTAKFLAFAVVVSIIITSLIFLIIPMAMDHPLDGKEAGDDISMRGRLVSENETAITGIETDGVINWSFDEGLRLEKDGRKIEIRMGNETTIEATDYTIIYDDIDHVNGSKMYRYNASDLVWVAGEINIDNEGEMYIEVSELETTSPEMPVFGIGLIAFSIFGFMFLVPITIFYYIGRKHEKRHMEKYRKAVSGSTMRTVEERDVVILDGMTNQAGKRLGRISLTIIILVTILVMASIVENIIYGFVFISVMGYMLLLMGLSISGGFLYRSRILPRKVGVSREGVNVEYGRMPFWNPLKAVKWEKVRKIVIMNGSNLNFVLKNEEERNLISVDVDIIEKIIRTFLSLRKREDEYDRYWKSDRTRAEEKITWKRVGLISNFLVMGIFLLFIFPVIPIVIFFIIDTLLQAGIVMTVIFCLFLFAFTLFFMIMGIIYLFFSSVMTGMKKVGVDSEYLYFQPVGEKRKRIYPPRIPKRSIIGIEFFGPGKMKLGTAIHTSFGLSYHIQASSKGTAEWLKERTR